MWNFLLLFFLSLSFLFLPINIIDADNEILSDNFFITDEEGELIVSWRKRNVDNSKTIIGNGEKNKKKREKFDLKKYFVSKEKEKKGKENRRDKYKIDWNIVYKLAEGLGYKKREEIDLNLLVNFNAKRKLEADTLYDLKEMMRIIKLEKGIELNLVSAFRSYEDQKKIFEYKYFKKCKYKKTENCKFEILNILNYSSPPKYSKHHTGKVVDLACGRSKKLSDSFRYTECYKWLSENDFQNAKRFNFYPSYPYGTKREGPVPEPWEFYHQ